VNNLINPNIYAHPSLRARAEAGDARLARKVMEVPPDDAGSASGLASDDVFVIYGGPSAPVPIIRNEELILLRAEALIMMDMLAEGVADLNTVRAVSGTLAAYGGAMTQDALIDQLLYERRYSLMFEGGFPWIDARRFDKVDDLLGRDPGVFDHVNIRYPLPLAECNARPDEARCSLGSR
jgi:hypothetical protein